MRDLTNAQAREMALRRGGRRPGQKAAHTLDAQELRKILIERAQLAAIPIADALINQAQKGNIPAIKELYDRTVGKAVENHNVTGSIEIKIDI